MILPLASLTVNVTYTYPAIYATPPKTSQTLYQTIHQTFTTQKKTARKLLNWKNPRNVN